MRRSAARWLGLLAPRSVVRRENGKLLARGCAVQLQGEGSVAVEKPGAGCAGPEDRLRSSWRHQLQVSDVLVDERLPGQPSLAGWVCKRATTAALAICVCRAGEQKRVTFLRKRSSLRDPGFPERCWSP